MYRIFYLFVLAFAVQINGFAQNSINDYKYIIVPQRYEFLKEKDKYQLNSLTKFLFNKYGYTAYIEGEDFPSDLADNQCLALMADVEDSSSMLRTKVSISLKNCDGKLIMTSRVGDSKEKQYQKAYNLALRKAFETFQHLQYAYRPNEVVTSRSKAIAATVEKTKQQQEIEKLKEEIKSLKEEQQSAPTAPEPKTATSVVPEPVTNVGENVGLNATLYAQPIDKGYQLVDSTPKVVLVLLDTGIKDVFSVKDSKAIVYKKDSGWIYSEDGSILSGNPIDIKF